tara:strand:+ start:2334 stop:2822 length:489 start_codon:yes stop_codon:yes gene_type:complete
MKQETFSDLVKGIDMSVYPNDNFQTAMDEIKYMDEKIKEVESYPPSQEIKMNLGGFSVVRTAEGSVAALKAYRNVLRGANIEDTLGGFFRGMSNIPRQKADGYEMNVYSVFFKKTINGKYHARYADKKGELHGHVFKNVTSWDDAMDIKPRDIDNKKFTPID